MEFKRKVIEISIAKFLHNLLTVKVIENWQIMEFKRKVIEIYITNFLHNLFS